MAAKCIAPAGMHGGNDRSTLLAGSRFVLELQYIDIYIYMSVCSLAEVKTRTGLTSEQSSRSVCRAAVECSSSSSSLSDIALCAFVVVLFYSL